MIIGIKMPINISNFEFLLSSKSSLLNIIDLILLLEGFLNNVLKVSFSFCHSKIHFILIV